MGNDQPIRELEGRWGISRNALKSRAAALGVELIRVSSTDTRWPAAYVDLGDQLHQHLQGGGTLKDFPGSRVALTASTTATSESKAITKGVDAEALAAVVATVMAQCTSSLPAAADPLARAKGLAEAADHGLVLTTDELAALGVKGVDGFGDGDLAYGYIFSKHTQRNRTLWTVERAIKQKVADGQPSLAPAKGEKRVGFDVAALMPAMTIEAISLPYFSS
jgi:hypothetical protein